MHSTRTGPGPDLGDLVRIEKGAPTDEEIAALTVALLTRSAALPAEEALPEHRARWQRLERARGHRTPRSWRGERPADRATSPAFDTGASA